MHKQAEKTVRDIKSLKIQGARNVATAALKALIVFIEEGRAETKKEFLEEFRKTVETLSRSRPTEPMMRNLLQEAAAFAEESKEESLAAFRNTLKRHEEKMLKQIEKDKQKLVQYGARLIPNNALVLTHCHSSTATGILIKAKKMKKRFRVVAFETRPRYQGRKTAKELAGAGIDVTLAVDGSMSLFMKKADIVLVGADSITSRGDLINKIGTSTLAHIAKMYDVSFYVAAELSKYSPKTIFGTREKIEERDFKEVWKTPPKNVKIRNPAFEATSAKYINGYVTELGVIPPPSFFSMATKKLGIRLYE
ncbi:S-methyl-5-thioribose-1-phosphate isomerase [Candidatus Micrarchaeota archaeon]|nr:S-methyl-5-thioribose-1-phosphate isomerase [Candidatus Micrarchaeota archaeon]